MYDYECTILAWLDGDTCRVQIQLGFHLCFTETVRVDGINAPEIHSTNDVEKTNDLNSKRNAEFLAPVGSVVRIKTAKAGRDTEKFGRWLAKITLADGTDFGEKQIASGYAVEYHGEKRPTT